MRTNCVLWAIALYRRRRRAGKRGYILLRRSHWGKFPHCLYAEKRRNGTLRVVSYVPTNPRHKKVPPPLFRGTSKFGDL